MCVCGNDLTSSDFGVGELRFCFNIFVVRSLVVLDDSCVLCKWFRYESFRCFKLSFQKFWNLFILCDCEYFLSLYVKRMVHKVYRI